jgi:hypothetical protein
VSASIKKRTSPPVRMPPAFLADGHGGRGFQDFTNGERRASATVPSSEPASTTKTSSGGLLWAARSESRPPRRRSSFRAGITTLVLVIAPIPPPGLARPTAGVPSGVPLSVSFNISPIISFSQANPARRPKVRSSRQRRCQHVEEVPSGLDFRHPAVATDPR